MGYKEVVTRDHLELFIEEILPTEVTPDENWANN